MLGFALSKKERLNIQSLVAHPRSPDAYWLRFPDEDTDGWSHPGLRTLHPGEVTALFPEAMETFDVYAAHVSAIGRLVFDQHSGPRDHSSDNQYARLGRLEVSVPLNHFGSRRAVWNAEMRIWERYTRGVTKYPLRDAGEPCLVLRTTPTAVWYVCTDGTANVVKWLPRATSVQAIET